MQLRHRHFPNTVITENPAIQKIYIHFFIDNSNANISLYTLSCPDFNLGQLKVHKMKFTLELSMNIKILDCWVFGRPAIIAFGFNNFFFQEQKKFVKGTSFVQFFMHFQKISDRSEFLFCITIHKKLIKSCSLDKLLV